MRYINGVNLAQMDFSPMRFEQYQSRSALTAIYPGQGTVQGVYYCVLGLGGEVGELQNKIKKVMRDSKGSISGELKIALRAELGDVLWYLSQLASELDLELEDIAWENCVKLEERQAKGTLSGSGDDR